MLKKYSSIPIWIYGICLFTYVLFRAIYIPFTFDEVTTSQIANGDDWYKLSETANNHFLNVVLIRLSLFFFEASEWAYRLPNILSFIIYLVYSFKLSKIFTPTIPIAAFILLTSFPFLLDFFGLARGYALATSFMLCSIYYLYQFCKNQKSYHGLLSLLLGIIAVLSNFVFFNYLLPAIFVMLVYSFLNSQKLKINLVVILTTSAAFLYIILPIVFELKEKGELYFGGRSNFFADTILSLGRCFSYHKISPVIGKLIFAILFILALLISGYHFYSIMKKKVLEANQAISIVFVVSILSAIAQHIIFETHHLVERTAIIYYPLMILVLLSIVKLKLRVYSKYFIPLIALIFLFQSINSFNTSHTYSWRFDAGSKEVVNYLKQNTSKEDNYSIGMDFFYTSTFWYYKQENKLHNFQDTELVNAWQYDHQFEELYPEYYLYGDYSPPLFKAKDIETLFADSFDYYYLTDDVVKVLIEENTPIEILLHFDEFKSTLFKLSRDANMINKK